MVRALRPQLHVDVVVLVVVLSVGHFSVKAFSGGLQKMMNSVVFSQEAVCPLKV